MVFIEGIKNFSIKQKIHKNIEAKKNPLMSGREHAWDLITMHDQATASGLYLFTVEDKNSGQIKEGKFLIIK